MATMRDTTRRDYADESIWMWLWFVASTLATGLIAGAAFPITITHDYGETSGQYGWPAMFVGLVVGAIAAIPVMVVFRILAGIMVNTAVAASRTRALAEALERDTMPTPSAGSASGDPGALPTV